LEGHTGDVICLTLHGNKLFSGSGYGDSTIRVWDADTHKHLATLAGHTNDVECLTLYGDKLFSAQSASRDDGTIRVWDADTHKHLATLEGHTKGVECLTLYGNKLFSGSWDRTIRVWNVKEEDS
jgi:F-box/WD-40 domain protein 7